MLGFKLNHVSKRGHWGVFHWQRLTKPASGLGHGYRNWPQYALRCRGWYCYPAQYAWNRSMSVVLDSSTHHDSPGRTYVVNFYFTMIPMSARARLGRVAPLGWLRSVFKSDVECRFVHRNGQMALKVKVNASHVQYQLWESQDAYLVQI